MTCRVSRQCVTEDGGGLGIILINREMNESDNTGHVIGIYGSMVDVGIWNILYNNCLSMLSSTITVHGSC